MRGAVLLAILFLWPVALTPPCPRQVERAAPEHTFPEVTEAISSSISSISPATSHADLGGGVCSQACSWSWKALRCSAGCKVRAHWPGLQGSCTPM